MIHQQISHLWGSQSDIIKESIDNISDYKRNQNYTEVFFSYWIEHNITSYHKCQYMLSFQPTPRFMNKDQSTIIKQTSDLASKLKYFFEARSVYINNWGLVISNDTLYVDNINSRTNFIYRVHDGIVERHVPIGMFFSNRFLISHFYAHWIIDFFIPVFLMPKPIRDVVPVIVPKGILPSIIQMLNLIGIKDDRIIMFNNSTNFMYVDKLYSTIGKSTENRFYGGPMKTVQNFFKDKLKLSKAKPNNFIFQNRKKDENRCVSNWDELFNLTITLYPQYNWNMDNLTTYDLYQVSRFFNSILCLVSPTGSNIANTIFMQPKSVALVIIADWLDIPAMASCVSCDIFMIVTHAPGNHWEVKPWIINITLFNESIARTVNYIQNNYSILLFYENY